jgi:hypothetical protein
MSAFPQQRKKLFLAQRFSRLVVRLRDPEWQRYGKVLFLGKALGVGVVLLVVTVVSALFCGRVYAADAEVKAADIVNPINTTATFVVAYGVMRLVNATGTLRVSREGELYGLDLHEHGISAYPEYVISSAGTPVGLADESESRPARSVKFEALILREKQNY